MQDEDQPFKRGLLSALQLTALALSALILSEFAIERAAGIPDSICVAAPSPQQK